MGFLKDQGKVIVYDESKKYHQYIKEHGIIQFLNLYKKFSSCEKDPSVFYWGDELEYQIVYIDANTGYPRISLNTDHIFQNVKSDLICVQYEYGRWMVEAVPRDPYRTLCNPGPILDNLKARRDAIEALLTKGEILFSAPVFPLLGVDDDYFIDTEIYKESNEEEEEKIPIKNSTPEKNGIEKSSLLIADTTKNELKNHDYDHINGDMIKIVKNKKKKIEKNPFSKSLFLDDEIINQHPRFPNLTRNIRLRRGEKVCIKVPLYQDEKTKMIEASEDEPYPGYIYMDAMGFGMGNCSLQVTFSTKNVNQARYLTDQLAVFAPLFLALSAGSPIFKGKLADVDVRWKVIADSVDDRNAEERDENSPFYLPKSRYDSVSYFISNDPRLKPEYNDIKFRVNEEIMQFASQKAKLMDVELDQNLLNHLGFLFVRDPLVIFEDKIDLNDEENTNHFENIQSTNWNSVRFKPPPSFDSNIGWRVELRPCEIQLTDEENASFILFALFITRYIKLFNPNFYMPMSLVDENFRRAHLREAVKNEKFWFRKNIPDDTKDEYVELTLEEFFKGKEGNFTGMLYLLDKLAEKTCILPPNADEHMKALIARYKSLNQKMMSSLVDRATGKHLTLATWIRKFVQNHPDYHKDSIISKKLGADLILAMNQISQGKKIYKDFLP